MSPEPATAVSRAATSDGLRGVERHRLRAFGPQTLDNAAALIAELISLRVLPVNQATQLANFSDDLLAARDR